MGTVQVLYILGLGAGSAVCGKLGDTIGRKPALALAILLCSAAELLGAFNSYLAGLYTYAGTRFLAGVGQQVRVYCTLELETKVKRRAFSCLKAPTSAFTFKTLC